MGLLFEKYLLRLKKKREQIGYQEVDYTLIKIVTEFKALIASDR